MKKIIVASVLAGLVSSAAMAAPGAQSGAQSDDRRGEGRSRPGNANFVHVVMLLKRADTNQDYQIDLDEWNAVKTAGAEKGFARLDTDEDELLSFEEFDVKKGRKGRKPGKGESEGEGEGSAGRELSEEVKACIEDLREDDEDHQTPTAEEAFASLDSNEDGYLDLAEFTAGALARAETVFNKMDTNEDDVIEISEVIASLEKMKERKEAVAECVRAGRDVEEELDDLSED